MSLDISGAILEGIRVSPSSNAYNYPPRNFVQSSQESAFNTTSRRADYLLFPYGQLPGTDGMAISDSNLRFRWSRNDDVIRFDWDGSAQRWSPSVGAPPVRVGTISNSPRLFAATPKTSDLTVSPYAIYLELPRLTLTNGQLSFTLITVENQSQFTALPAGSVQVSLADGALNFSDLDIYNSTFSGKSVYVSQQSFFDRTKFNGVVATVDSTGSYLAYLNPIPSATTTAYLRVGGGEFLDVQYYPNESSMPTPSIAGSANVALDTGRLLIANAGAFEGEEITYEGVSLGEVALSQFSVGSISRGLLGPVLVGTVSSLTGETDASRYVFYGQKSGKSNYFLNTRITTATPSSVNSGEAVIDSSNGQVFISSTDSGRLEAYLLKGIDSYLVIDQDVTVQVYRSGVNGVGVETVPDFIEFYNVQNATIQDGIQASPFVVLPSKPVVNSSLSYSVSSLPSSSGSFVGTLNPVTDPSLLGLGYDLDVPNRRLSFVNRSQVSRTLAAPASTFGLGNGPVSVSGLSITRNGSPIVEGDDYNIDYSSGQVTFVESIGEGGSFDIDSVSGTAILPNIFSTSSITFDSSFVGKYVVVSAGSNFGFRRIVGISSTSSVALDSSWATGGSQVVDIKLTFETVAKYFWESISPPLTTFSLSKSSDRTSGFQDISSSNFSILDQVGQINLNSMVDPGLYFKASYIWLSEDANGQFTVQTPRTEILPSKIRAEAATFTPGSKSISINPQGRTVVASKGFKVSIDGVTQPSTSVVFTAPGSLFLGRSLFSEEVLVDYWVEETLGASLNFNTSFKPILVDYATFTAGSTTATLNGNLSNRLVAGSFIRLNNSVNQITSSAYDGVTDKTTLIFSTPIVTTFIGSFLATSIIDFSASTDFSVTLAAASSSFVLPGSYSIRALSIIKIDGDPYIVSASSVNGSSTTVSLSSALVRNYINPSIAVSIFPVNTPTGSFATSASLVSSQPFSLYKSGPVSGELINNVDFTMSDGGTIELKTPLVYGDTLTATYVSRVVQPAGTVFGYNYAYSIAPSLTNGLLGQRLTSNYKLYSPDSFYFRKETILSYVPEVSQSISSGSSPSPGGPNTQAPTAPSLKSYGIPSLDFDARKYSNLDLVTRRLLKYYNDYTNYWDKYSSNLDGRVIGGTSGFFRYDGSEGTNRSTFAEVTNDIDDRIFIKNRFVCQSLFPFIFTTVPVYRPLYQYSTRSRLFPTASEARFLVNDQTDPANDDAVLGNLGYSDIKSVGTILTAQAVAQFIRVSSSTIRILQNGDAESLNPAFSEDDVVYLCRADGMRIPGVFTIQSVSAVTGGVDIGLDLTVTISTGSVVFANKYFTSGYDATKYYVPDTDVGIDSDTGDVTNVSNSLLIATGFQREVAPNSIYTSRVVYNNQDTDARTIPALFGGTSNDDGTISVPLMKYANEFDLVSREKAYLENSSLHGTGGSFGDPSVINMSISVSIGDQVQFLSGPNAGNTYTVLFPFGGNNYAVTPSVSVSDSVYYPIVRKAEYDSYLMDLLAQIGVLYSNVETAPETGAIIGGLASELKQLNLIAANSGVETFSGSITITSATTATASGLPSSTAASFLFIASGDNWGYYKIESILAGVITIDSLSPFASFPSTGSVSAQIISRYAFLTDSGSEALTECMQNTLAYWRSTALWLANIQYSGFSGRLSTVTNRVSEISGNISRVSSVCESGDSLYNRRYLWINQRVSKTDGFLTKKAQAEAKFTESRAKLIATQQKRLALNSLL